MIVDGDTLRQTFDVYQENMPVDGDLVESVRSRARADRRNRLATVGGVLCALLLVGGGTWLLETRSPTSTDAAGEPAGKAVGERLGLPPLAFPGDGCKQWAGYEHDWGYCLDDVAGKEVDLILLSQEIYGYEMTDARITYVETQLELRDYRRPVTDEEKAKAKELEAILDETRPQLDSLYEPMDIEDFPGLAGEDLADAAGLVPSKGIAHVGSGAWGVELGPVFYDLDGVSATERGGEEWASRLSERDLRTAVVPDVVGLTEDEAVRAIENAGFAVEIDRAYNSDIAAGVVNHQFSPAGGSAMLSRPLRIMVSKGPIPATPPASAPAIAMPNLVGLNRQEAEETVRRLNLYGPFMKYTVVGSPTTVIRQEPAAGSEVYGSTGEFPGTVVNLWIGD